MPDEYEKIVFVDTLGIQTNIFEDQTFDRVLTKSKTIYIKRERNNKNENQITKNKPSAIKSKI